MVVLSVPQEADQVVLVLQVKDIQFHQAVLLLQEQVVRI
jgi:hypothetical protein